MSTPYHSSSSRAFGVLFVGAVVAMLGCKSTDKSGGAAATAPAAKTSAQISNEMTSTSQVTAVDKANRRVTIRREDGTQLQLQVGPAARNFEQVNVGDKLRVHYRESILVTKLPPGTTTAPAVAAVGAGRTAAGEKPGGGAAAAISLRVRIESLDLPHDIVVFALASGELLTHRLVSAEGREFAEGLKVGDVVQLDYDEAVALSVDAM